MFGEVVPRDVPPPSRPLTADERAVLRKDLYDHVRLAALERKTGHAIALRTRRELKAWDAVEEVVAGALKRLDRQTDPRVQDYMKKYGGPALTDMGVDSRALQRTFAEELEKFLKEPYPVGLEERPPTILESIVETIFGGKD